MLRKTLLMFALACSTTAIGCVDDGPTDDGPQKSGEDDPDFDHPDDGETPPVGCRVQLQGKDDPDCTPTTK